MAANSFLLEFCFDKNYQLMRFQKMKCQIQNMKNVCETLVSSIKYCFALHECMYLFIEFLTLDFFYH